MNHRDREVFRARAFVVAAAPRDACALVRFAPVRVLAALPVAPVFRAAGLLVRAPDDALF
jgi:hypothetical protein